MASKNPTMQMQTPAVNPPSRTLRPFRQATVGRVETLPAENALALGAARIPIERKVEGSGYIYRILLDVVATGGTGVAAVYQEDGPWSALDNITFRDVNGEIVNLSGYNAFLSALADANYRGRFTDQSALNSLVPTSGNFSFQLPITIGTNRRDLLGILPNQDRAQGYSLRTDVAATSAIWSTNPTTVPALSISKFYENYSVPLPTGPDGAAQQVFPDGFGTVHYTTSTVSEAAPNASSTVNHYLRRIGNTLRWVMLVFRAGNGATPRATADATPPASIRLKAGEDTLFNESYRYRRARMYEQFGFDFPAGVLLYAFTEDFQAGAGNEVGDDYISSQSLVNAQFQITYSSAFTAGSTLTIVTDDVAYAAPNVAAVA